LRCWGAPLGRFTFAASPACLVVVLLITNIINFTDRALIGALGEPIERDLHLTDSQLALIGGLAFMTVYTFMALPLARWADRGHRKQVLLVSVLLWCAMTALCGLAQSFHQLVLTRIGMAIGEAGVVPASLALLSERFSSNRLGTALAVFWIGTTIGDALGPLVGGWLNDIVGWRATFLILGPVGLVVVPLIAWFVREPAGFEDGGRLDTQAPSLMTSIRFLWSISCYRSLWIGSALMLTAASAYGLYVVPFFMRAHQITSGQVGALLGPLLVTAGILGAPLGGLIYDRLGHGRPERGLAIPIAALVVSGLFAVAAWQTPVWRAGVAYYALAVFCHMMLVAPTYALAQKLTPAEMRATSAAFLNMGMALLGSTLGPLAAGMMSDVLRPQWGVRSLAHALSLMAVFQFAGAAVFLWTSAVMRANRRNVDLPARK
jgi:MFS transporter, Spinster family, sphingosine-1-phosphate transporter